MTRYTPRSHAPTQKVQAAPAVASQIYLLLIPDAEHRRLLVFPSEDGWSLPLALDDDEGGWALPTLGLTTPRRTDVLDTLDQESGLRLTLLHQFDVTQPSTEKPLQICTLENHSDKWQPPSGGRWIEACELGQLCFRDATEQTAIDSWFAETTGGGEPLVPWWQPGWLLTAIAWTESELHRRGMSPRGSIKQIRSWYRSSIFRQETDVGAVYFKASSLPFAHEAALTEWLTGWTHAGLPTLLAVDPSRCWMLTLDMTGTLLAETPDVTAWESALRTYARLQMAALPHLTKLHSLGCLDLRLDRIVSESDALLVEAPHLLQGSPDRLSESELVALASLTPQLRQACVQASGYRVPCTLEHGDYHPLNVVVSESGPLLFDWSEGYITHPFFGLAFLLWNGWELPAGADVLERLRDAYLDEWKEYESRERCHELLRLLKDLCPLYLAHQVRAQLRILWRQHGSRPLLPLTAVEWSIRMRQRWLSELLRRLLNQSANA